MSGVGTDTNDYQSFVDVKQSNIYNYLHVKGSVVEKNNVLEKEKEKRDLEGCTFMPKINKKRAQTIKRNDSIANYKPKEEKTEDTFVKLSKQQRVFEKYQHDKAELELQYCTFKPQLDPKSR